MPLLSVRMVGKQAESRQQSGEDKPPQCLKTNLKDNFHPHFRFLDALRGKEGVAYPLLLQIFEMSSLLWNCIDMTAREELLVSLRICVRRKPLNGVLRHLS